jgi:hypothetical protein
MVQRKINQEKKAEHTRGRDAFLNREMIYWGHYKYMN